MHGGLCVSIEGMGLLSLLPALLLLAQSACGLKTAGARSDVLLSQGLSQEAKQCLRGKTVYIAGNTVSRRIYFTLKKLLEDEVDFLSNFTADWDKHVKEKDCLLGPLGFMSCRADIVNADVTLIHSFTQRLEEFQRQMKKANRKKIYPDIVAVEIGLDHIENQVAFDDLGTFVFEKTVDSEFANVSSMMDQWWDNHKTRFVWRAVPHFNQSAAPNAEWTNAKVDRWNQRLFQNFQANGYLDSDKFRWYSGTAELVDKALARQDGLAMADWVDPDTETVLKLTTDLVANLCA